MNSPFLKFIDTLENLGDKFAKSRIAAAISLGFLGDQRAIPHLKGCFNTKVWKLLFVCLFTCLRLFRG